MRHCRPLPLLPVYHADCHLDPSKKTQMPASIARGQYDARGIVSIVAVAGPHASPATASLLLCFFGFLSVLLCSRSSLPRPMARAALRDSSSSSYTECAMRSCSFDAVPFPMLRSNSFVRTGARTNTRSPPVELQLRAPARGAPYEHGHGTAPSSGYAGQEKAGPWEQADPGAVGEWDDGEGRAWRRERNGASSGRANTSLRVRTRRHTESVLRVLAGTRRGVGKAQCGSSKV